MGVMPSDPPDAFVVRRATADDAEELARIRWQWSNEGRTPTATREAFLAEMVAMVHAYLEGGHWTIWVAVDGTTERLAGTAFLQRIDKVPRPYPRPSSWGYVSNVYVVPELRDRGIGRRIMDALIRESRHEGMDRLLLSPSDRAVPFYRRLGFGSPRRELELALEED